MTNPRSSRLRDTPDPGDALYTRPAGWPVPAEQYAALREGAALVDLSHKTLLRLAGEKSAEMLNAVLTNDVPVEESRGVYALLLNPKGRVQADLRILKSGESLLIAIEPEGTASAKELLGRYAPFYRAQLEDLSETDEPWGILGFYGSRAADLLDGLELAEHETAEIAVGDTTVLAAGVAAPVPGYDLLGPADALLAVREHLADRGAVPTGSEAYETARVEAGVPRFGPDITPENFPAEAGILQRAVSFEKGCYPGQETVARMHYRGHPNKTLHRLVVDGEPPAPGADIIQNGKRVGTVTSVAPLPINGRRVALGYLSRSADTGGDLRADESTVSVLDAGEDT